MDQQTRKLMVMHKVPYQRSDRLYMLKKKEEVDEPGLKIT